MMMTVKERRERFDELRDYLISFERLLLDRHTDFLSVEMRDVIQESVHDIAQILKDSYDDGNSSTGGEKPTYDLANITGNYTRDFSNWKYLCRKCHMKSDGRMNLKSQKGR